MKTAIGVLLLGSLCLAAGGRSVDDLLRLLAHEDPVVREEAALGILAKGFTVLAHLKKAAEADESAVAREAGRLRRTLVLANRLRQADRKSVEFWVLLEELHEGSPEREREAAVRLAIGRKEAVTTAFDRALAINAVRSFCRDWNETYTRGSKEEKKYDALEKRLFDDGVRAVPHLMRVLETHDKVAFFNMDVTRGVTARMQVRAIFGLSFLMAKEAIPHLIVHAHSVSMTAASNAGAAVKKMTTGGATPPLAAPDLPALIAWWRKHRTEYALGATRIARALLADLHRDAAAELAGRGGPFTAPKNVEMLPGALTTVRTNTAKLVALMLGREIDYDPEAPAVKRLAQVRALESGIE
jgi:hypothetical protein